MSDEDTTVWQRVRKKRSYEGEERRSPDRRHEPVNYLAWLPLALTVLAGVAGYVRTQAEVEVLRRDVDTEISRAAETHKDLRDWNIKLSERIREHRH